MNDHVKEPAIGWPNASTQYTWADYARWEGEWELIRGQACMSPSPFSAHSLTVARLISLLDRQLDASGSLRLATELDWIVAPDTTIRPDVMLYAGHTDTWLRHAPLVVIEVLSEATARRDREDKFGLCEEHGVEWFLLADPVTRGLEVHRRISGVYHPVALSQGRVSLVLPGQALVLDTVELWRVLDR